MDKQRLTAIADAVHSMPALTGVIVGYYGDRTCTVIDPGSKVALAYWKTIVIIEETQLDGPMAIPQRVVEFSNPPRIITNRSRMWPEFIGAGLSCTFAVGTGVGVVGGLFAAPVSGGSSTLVTVASWAGFLTFSAQCVNGIYRSVEVVRNPNSDSLEQLDEWAPYKWGSRIVDAIGLVSGGITLAPKLKSLLQVLQSRGGLVSAERLALMGRAEKAKAIQDALTRAGKDPATRKAVEEALEEAGIKSRTLRRVGTNEVIAARNAVTVSAAISSGTAKALAEAVAEAVKEGRPLVVNAMPKEWVGSASGLLNEGREEVSHILIHAVSVGGGENGNGAH